MGDKGIRPRSGISHQTHVRVGSPSHPKGSTEVEAPGVRAPLKRMAKDAERGPARMSSRTSMRHISSLSNTSAQETPHASVVRYFHTARRHLDGESTSNLSLAEKQNLLAAIDRHTHMLLNRTFVEEPPIPLLEAELVYDLAPGDVNQPNLASAEVGSYFDRALHGLSPDLLKLILPHIQDLVKGLGMKPGS